VERGTGIAALGGARILLPRAREARDHLPRELEAAGAVVEALPCYENVLPEIDPARLRALECNPPDVLVFTSSSAVTNFVRLLGDEPGKKLLNSRTVAALGPVTAATAESFGKRVEILPGQNTASALVAAIAAHYR
jgi:uroporphyrinogen III methyltransferase/synthase